MNVHNLLTICRSRFQHVKRQYLRPLVIWSWVILKCNMKCSRQLRGQTLHNLKRGALSLCGAGLGWAGPVSKLSV
jgi:hypothetical protein